MNVTDPWAFGWTQLLTLVGFLITIVIAISGFRTFGRWKRERIEERRIDIAFETLSIARESKIVFRRIRDPHGFEGEWRNMPVKEGESVSDRNMRGGPYATLVRINAHADYFARMSRLQPQAIAVFGDAAEAAFERFNKANDFVRDSATFLAWQPVRPEKPSQEDFDMRMSMRGDLWASFGADDRVERELSAFRSEIEKLFRPVIERRFKIH
jgi:hypothetical protein